MPSGYRKGATNTLRFHAKLEVLENGCWLWKGFIQPNGYGLFSMNAVRRYAHRASYELFVGKIPAGLWIDHLCRNRSCVNPAHLEPVTPRENLVRGETVISVNVAKQQCVNGHCFDEANTYYWNGNRYCRKCRRARSEVLRNRRRAQSLTVEAFV